MKRGVRRARCLLAIACLVSSATASYAHSASDAYLTLEFAAGKPGQAASTIHVQWDIALRDLDFVIGLDDDGDGSITWQELRGHQHSIARYALSRLSFRSGRARCAVKATRQLVDVHADGAYAALFLDVACGKAGPSLDVDYRLFFDVDPSHRAILVSRFGAETATALLSPANATVHLATGAPTPQ